MSTRTLTKPGGGAIDRVIERQMRNWEIARAQRFPRDVLPRRVVHDFVTVSCMEGCGGDVAKRLAERLGWPLFDRELLQTMAANDAVREQIYATMDEHDLSWLEETLLAATQGGFARNDYFHKLTSTILALVRQGPGVFVGRGADLLLPQDRGVRVRLVASEASCVREHAQRHGVTVEQAREGIAQTEAQRAEFIRRHFRRSPDDLARFDVVINLDRFSAPQTVDLVLAALKIHGIP